MYGWEKSMREDRLRKNSGNQSFSSSLLDEMYRSIDGGDGKCRDVKVHKEKITKKQSGNGGGREKSSDIGDEEMASLRRACLIEKWMEKKVNEKMSAGRKSSMPGKEENSMQYSDPVFYSSSSCSSDSSSGGFSSSETESFGAAKSRTSCFAAPRPNPVKTSVSAHLAPRESQAELYPLKDGNHQRENIDEGLIQSKARAMKIYANLKKVKQPISPGGRLTSFINLLFTNGSAKKTKYPTPPSCSESVERKLKSSKSSSKCSSASSFSRSCLSKSSPNSREKLNNGVKRTVRFYPVSVIVDEDARPCGHKCIYAEDSDKIGRHEPKLQVKEKKNNPRVGVSRSYQTRKNDFLARDIRAEDDYDYDDAASDSSSDLFELDHLALFKNERFSEELPVYETTHFDRNRAIASSFIRN